MGKSADENVDPDCTQVETKKEEKKQRDSDLLSSSIVDDEDAGKCGYGSWEPDCLQCCNSAKGFLVMYCLLVIVQGMLVNGFVNVSISSLEKRFGFGSSLSGVMATGYDIAFCCVTMFVTYFLAASHRPRIVGIGIFIMGVGATVFMLPHFTTDKYQYSAGLEETCTDDPIDCSQSSGRADYSNYIYVFILGQLLHGLGCTPLYTLGLSYMEDSVPKDSASLYLGIGNAASIFGPVLGYGLGGVVLGIYVDFDTVPSSEIEIDSSDPRWVGAWWLGIMASMVCAYILCIPLFGFPKVVPGTARFRAMRESEVPPDAGEDIVEREGFGKDIKEFPRALLALLKNPTYMFGSLASCSEAMVVSGFTTFLPKIIENEFQQTAGSAAVVAGVIGVPGGIIGHLISGILVNRFQMKTAKIYISNVIYCLIVCATAPVLLLACSNRQVAGVTTPYLNNDVSGGVEVPCNANCSCQEEYFIPVCGADNINYFTACHAGCFQSEVVNDTTYFYNCSCLNTTSDEGWMAREGYCDSECTSLSLFLGIFFVVVMFNFMSNTPALVATFRVVPPEMRSFALGVQWLLIRALGSIPGPILFGFMIDLTCIFWQERQCTGTQGSCWINDSKQMAVNVLAISIACKIVSAILFFLAYWKYKAPVSNEDLQELNQQTEFVNDAFNEDDEPKQTSNVNQTARFSSDISSNVSSGDKKSTISSSSEDFVTVL